MPSDREGLPGTLKRSPPKKAQRTYRKALDSAHEQYDSMDTHELGRAIARKQD
ncbi:MAG TPA: ChaB family protein [Euzebya sp.]|nr:ChaB family protein [Euzebya sp.]